MFSQFSASLLSLFPCIAFLSPTPQNKLSAGFRAPTVQVGDGFNDTVNSLVQEGLGVGGHMVFTDSTLGVDAAAVDGDQASLVLGLGLSQGYSSLYSYCTKSADQTAACEKLKGKLSFYTGFPLSRATSDEKFETAYGTVRGNYTSTAGARNITGPYLSVDKPWLISPADPVGETPSPGALTVEGHTSLYGKLYVKGVSVYMKTDTSIALMAGSTMSLSSQAETYIRSKTTMALESTQGMTLTAQTTMALTSTRGMTLTAKSTMALKSTQGMTLKAESTMALESTQGMTLKAESTMALESTLGMTIKASTLGITAPTTIDETLKVLGTANVVGAFTAGMDRLHCYSSGDDDLHNCNRGMMYKSLFFFLLPAPLSRPPINLHPHPQRALLM